MVCRVIKRVNHHQAKREVEKGQGQTRACFFGHGILAGPVSFTFKLPLISLHRLHYYPVLDFSLSYQPVQPVHTYLPNC